MTIEEITLRQHEIVENIKAYHGEVAGNVFHAAVKVGFDIIVLITAPNSQIPRHYTSTILANLLELMEVSLAHLPAKSIAELIDILQHQIISMHNCFLADLSKE